MWSIMGVVDMEHVVLQGVAERCIVLQCVAVCYIARLWIEAHCHTLQYAATHCSTQIPAFAMYAVCAVCAVCATRRRCR